MRKDLISPFIVGNARSSDRITVPGTTKRNVFPFLVDSKVF